MQILMGQAVVFLGLLVTAFGVYSFLKLDTFYARIVITSKVEAMGFVTIVLGAMILGGFSSLTLKLAMILVFELLTVSVGAHAIARSAWKSGYHVKVITSTPEPEAPNNPSGNPSGNPTGNPTGTDP